MGWSSGSELYTEVISVIKDEVPDFETRVRMHKKLIKAFGNHDWDTKDECEGEDPAYDKALSELYPG
jgi:hypothetical protein